MINKVKAKEAYKLKQEGYSNTYIMNKLKLNYTKLVKHLQYYEKELNNEKTAK